MGFTNQHITGETGGWGAHCRNIYTCPGEGAKLPIQGPSKIAKKNPMVCNPILPQ